MKKLIVTILIASLTYACSKKPDDFIGVHTSFRTTECTFLDTTEIVRSFFQNSYLNIASAKLAPIKIDVFKNGEELKATLSISTISGLENSGDGSTLNENKIDLTNLHIINDTLVCEMKQSFLFMSQSRDIKLSKSGDNFYITFSANKKDSIKESCNKFISNLNANAITFSCVNNLDFIKETNQCLAEKRFNEINTKYNKDKLDYLKTLLNSSIK